MKTKNIVNVASIVKDFLIKNNFSGLCHTDVECGCCIDDLFPCMEYSNECQPGYKVPDGKSFKIQLNKPKDNNESSENNIIEWVGKFSIDEFITGEKKWPCGHFFNPFYCKSFKESKWNCKEVGDSHKESISNCKVACPECKKEYLFSIYISQ